MTRIPEAPSLEEARAQLAALKQSIAAQNERLAAAHAAADPHRLFFIPDAARRRFEALCTPPPRRRPSTPEPGPLSLAIRC